MMRAFFIAAALSLLSAAPSLAQDERGYITGVGGFAASTDATSGARTARPARCGNTTAGYSRRSPSERASPTRGGPSW